MNKLLLILSHLVLITTTACSQFALPNANKPGVPQPAADKTTVMGQVVSSASGQPLANLLVRLGAVTHPENGQGGIYIMDEGSSPGALTDNQGYFIMQNVDPKEYVILVGFSAGQYKVIDDGASVPRVWTAEAGKVLDVGILKIGYFALISPRPV